MGARHRELMRAHYCEVKFDEVALLSIPIITKMAIQIRQGTCANMSHPGVGVPFCSQAKSLHVQLPATPTAQVQ
jgi:hypothetical protein